MAFREPCHRVQRTLPSVPLNLAVESIGPSKLLKISNGPLISNESITAPHDSPRRLTFAAEAGDVEVLVLHSEYLARALLAAMLAQRLAWKKKGTLVQV